MKNQYFEEDIERVILDTIPWKDIYNSTFLITGASGLIGSFIIDVLMKLNDEYDSNIKVIAMSRDINKLDSKFKKYNNYVKTISHDVAEEITLEENVDFIINGACNVQPGINNSAVDSIKSNILGMINLCEYAQKCSCKKIILLSSIAVYGVADGDEIFTEEKHTYIEQANIESSNYLYAYGKSKRMAEIVLSSYADKNNFDARIIRLGKIYGPTGNSSDTRAIISFFNIAASGKNIELKSSGNQVFAYCYISDAIAAIFYVLLCGDNLPYNCGEGEKMELRTFGEVVDLIAKENSIKVIRKNFTLEEEEKYTKEEYSVMASERLLELGWNKKVNMEDGIKRTSAILREKYN